MKHYRKIGCPACGVPWEPGFVTTLMDEESREKLRTLLNITRTPQYTPKDLPDGLTTDLLLKKGTRFW